MSILTKPWSIALLALLLSVGTQLVALKVYWSELFPEQTSEVLLVKRDDPKPLRWGFDSDSINSLERELKTRLDFLEIRAGELASYEERLKADREEIDSIKEQVERMRDELMQGVVKLENSEQENLRNLAKTYTTLSPEAAVSIFEQLDDPTVVKIMYFMKYETVGSILEEMATSNGGNEDQIKRAAKISDMLRLFTNNTTNNLQPNI